MSNLNSKIFDDDVEQVAIRKGFGEGFLLAGKQDKNVVGLCADLTESTQMILFKDAFPDRFIEVGVAEQNLASVASGMAAMGKVPFISSYAMFSPGRNWEQIRTTICYNNTNVKIAGSHAGVSVGPDGGTHQALEDIAITRVLPRMIVISPCDAIEAKKATIAAARIIGPTYIRLAREKTPVITTEATDFQIGKSQIFYDSNGKADVGIVATGALVHKALLAARQLEADGLAVKVLNVSTIKPLDEESILSLAKETGAIVTVEEHQIAAGMGSTISEYLAAHYPVRMAFVGVHDKFGQSGQPEELIEYYGMGVDSIVNAAKQISSRGH
ncbi:MAG TPA: transketolase C-terminal domain-containing protein [Chthoniobacterales bacterium]|jgi:transketolase